MKKPCVLTQHAAEMAALHQRAKVRVEELQAMFPQGKALVQRRKGNKI